MATTKARLTALYRAERDGRLAVLDRLIQRVADDIYPDVVSRCTYWHKGQREWKTGGTFAMDAAMRAFRRFVEAYERGAVTLVEVDGVVWAAHNNGSMADLFISDAADEADALAFLNGLSGTQRTSLALAIPGVRHDEA